MRLISIGEAARKLGVDPDKIRRNLCTDTRGNECVQIDGLRLTVHRRGLLGKRMFDADEIAHKQLQLARSRRTGGQR